MVKYFTPHVGKKTALDHNIDVYFNFRITAKIDDEMLAYYCNEDLFLLEVRPAGASEDERLYDITFVELALEP